MEYNKRNNKNNDYALWNPFTDMRDLIKQMNYGPSCIVRAEGLYIYNARGQRYINAASSLWNVAVGHGREEIIDAVTEQMKELTYSSCFRQTHPKAIELANKLVELTDGFYGHVYLGSNGSEAIEAALKMTRQYFKQSNKIDERKRYKIISLKGAYHGVTYGAISTSGDEGDNNKFGPLLPGCVQIEPPYCYRCPYKTDGYPNCGLECTKALEDKIVTEGAEECAAFIIEPIMGVHGIITPPTEYYNKIGEICKKYGLLLIADEVTTGFGRTGSLFASSDWDIKPDILVVGKGISSGYLPLSATLATDEIYQNFNKRGDYFSHGSTASGHPACAAAGLANIDIILKENLIENSKKMGDYLISRLKETIGDREIIGEIRGRGLMIGIELVKDKETKEAIAQKDIFKILMDCYNMGLYVYLAPNLRLIGLFPPLIINQEIADKIVEIMDKAFKVGIKSNLTWASRFVKSNVLNK